ncbi:MAG: M23 family metallopeptidase [Acidimicrobiales bacterium]
MGPEEEVLLEPWPLGAGRWTIAQGTGPVLNHHWRAVTQRAALDIVDAARRGRSVSRLSPCTLEEFVAYGAPVPAPCDGTVAFAEGSLPDLPVPVALPAGNHVDIDTGGEQVLLAHLRQGSVAVRPGDKVRAGDEIGRVGNSGNSTEPHLHIHATGSG